MKLYLYLLKLLSQCADADYGKALKATFELGSYVGLAITPFAYLWNKISDWGIENQDYINIVLGAIIVDYLFGTYKHIFIKKNKYGERSFTWGGNGKGLVLKIALAVSGGFLFEGLSHLTAEAEIFETPLKIITRVIVFMYPAVSAWENIYIVSGGTFPPEAWMKRLGIFKNSLDIMDLTKKTGKE